MKKMATDVRIVLVRTSHAGNLGSVARAMKVMGLSNLILVNPQANHLSDDAKAMASHADDILQNAIVVNDLSKALLGSHFQFALSARTRYYSPPLVYLHELGQFLQENLPNPYENDLEQFSNPDIPNHSIAFIFGPERAGLENEDVMQCSHFLNIQTNPDYSSLNLSQAVQLVAYEIHRLLYIPAQSQEQRYSRQHHEIDLATHEQIQGMHQHLLQALEGLGYQKNPLFPQRLLQLWHKAHLNTEEVNIIRGISKLILKKTDK
jgi:tRNA/rRNA methyltransferase